jgi:hypothetical protein
MAPQAPLALVGGVDETRLRASHQVRAVNTRLAGAN